MSRKAFVDASRCDGLPTCIVKFTCPFGAVKQKMGFLGGTAAVIAEKCTGCGKCVTVCPHQAITLK